MGKRMISENRIPYEGVQGDEYIGNQLSNNGLTELFRGIMFFVMDKD